MLEADLWRSEAKIDALANPDEAALMQYRRDASGEIVAEEKDEIPMNKEEGMQRWMKEMELRFLRGDDTDFDYKTVDESEEYDDRGIKDREEEEKWFEDESPAWVGEDEHGTSTADKAIAGQTGVQDY
jgi:hypothetical protein